MGGVWVSLTSNRDKKRYRPCGEPSCTRVWFKQTVPVSLLFVHCVKKQCNLLPKVGRHMLPGLLIYSRVIVIYTFDIAP